MASQKKKLQQAAIKFRKENPTKHSLYCSLLSRMAQFIKESGAVEVTVGIKYGQYYETTNV